MKKETDSINTDNSTNSRILLHSCCAPCAAPSSERLIKSGNSVIVFFSNSNIYPHEEYLKRLESVQKLAEHLNIEVIVDSWDHDAWLEAVRGLEDEPEKGARCKACFSFNLQRTKKKTDELGIDRFTTTLTLSPHKVSSVVFESGHAFEGFVEENFKKNDGFRRSLELSKELSLYRQNYCGCEFSMDENRKS
ncbi:MAG: epoxyqueuosine reductase QueH [Spirochaetales bacterium]|nr:epoxyqueuosine reductase QueH [Spirochaetales bacterium]